MAWQVGFLVLAISTIGFLTLFNQLYKLVKWIWCTFIRTPKDLTTYGSWAIVTGCTDGIGKTLAFELASRGLNLILVSRNSNKLQQTLNEIREQFGEVIQMKIIVIDFAKTSNGKEVEEIIRKEIEGLDVGILVNNAGVNGNSPRFFHEFDSKEIEEVVDVNIGGLTWVTRAVLHGMMKRQKGAIVNMGSGSSEVPSFPLCDVYAASKAYVAMLSKSLSLEYKQYGIDIQCQVPMYVMTNMISVAVRRSSTFIPSAKMYSEASVTRIGYESLCFPYSNHAIQWWLVNEVLPEFLVNWANLATALKVRKKVLRKHYSINM